MWGRIKNSESLHFKELSSAAGGDNLPGVTNGDKRNKERNEEKKHHKRRMGKQRQGLDINGEVVNSHLDEEEEERGRKV